MSKLFQKLILYIFIILIQNIKGIIEKTTINPISLIDRHPPNLYKWIEENAHICTIVPINGKSLISFLSEDEGKKCLLCPELNIHEIPTMACAIEIRQNNIENLDIGCHKLPDLCVIELKNRYAEFYIMNNTLEKEEEETQTLTSLSSSDNNNKRSQEEKIFEATDLVFSTKSINNNNFNNNEDDQNNLNKIEKDEEEELKKEVLENLNNKGKEKPKIIKSKNNQNLNLGQSTTIRANIFAQMDGEQGIPLNIKMTPMSNSRNILISSSEGEKEEIILPPSQQQKQQNNNKIDENEIIEKIEKRVKNINKIENEDDINQEENKINLCKDEHELCCFWAISGECNVNPFWMRVKCPETCGTCGCKVKRADKCKSTGIKCILPSTTTTTETTITTTSKILTSTFRSTTKGPTPPPLTTNSTTNSRRRSRPTPPPKMPGHRPQRPKQFRTTSTTSKRPKIVGQVTEYPFPILNSKNLNKNISVIGDGFGDSESDNFNNLLNGDYSDETEEPQIEETTLKQLTTLKTVYEEEEKDKQIKELKNKNNKEEKKKIINKLKNIKNNNWMKLNLLEKTTPLEPLTIPTETSKTITTIKTSTNSATIITTTTRQTCFNYHKLCEFWAEMGECISNPFWMRPHCQKSCSSCGESLGDISTPKPRRGCTNIHILCPFWAFIGECERNPRWMGMHCRASCQLC